MCILINHHYYYYYYYYYYFSAFDHTSLHGEGNENVSSCQMFLCLFVVFFFLNFLAFLSSLLKWQILVNFPTGSGGPHPSSDSEKKSNRFLCLRPPNNVAKGNFKLCSYRFWREARCMCKIYCFSFTYWVRFVWRSHCLRRDRRLRRCSQDFGYA